MTPTAIVNFLAPMGKTRPDRLNIVEDTLAAKAFVRTAFRLTGAVFTFSPELTLALLSRLIRIKDALTTFTHPSATLLVLFASTALWPSETFLLRGSRVENALPIHTISRCALQLAGTAGTFSP